jgi:hypothetical protein
MLPGKIKLIITWVIFPLFVSPCLLHAQYKHRFEINIEALYSKEKDNITANNGYIKYSENYLRNGTGISFGISYRLNTIPVYLDLKMANISYNKYISNSNISVKDDYQKIKRNVIGCYLRYEFLPRCAVKPLVYIGVNYNSIGYERKNIIYSYDPGIDNENMQVDPVVWKYTIVQSNFGSLGYSVGLGFYFRISDRIGISFKRSYDLIPQEKTAWLGKSITVKSNSIGGYIRLSKRKTL